MAVKVGINGFGRIGRMVLRASLKKGEVEIVGINDLTDAKTLAYLLKYDSTQGQFDGTVEVKDNAIIVNGKAIPVTAIKNPADLPWKEYGVEVVVESTGVFRQKEQCLAHIQAGAKKVLLTVPPKDEIDNMIVLGVNDEALKDTDVVVSNASLISGR